MAISPLGGMRFARGLDLTNGRVPRSILRKAGSVGVRQVLGRRISLTKSRNIIKPIGSVVAGPISPTRARPLVDSQRSVRTIRAGVGAHSRTKVW